MIWPLSESDSTARLRLKAISFKLARSYLFRRGYFYGIPRPEFFVPSGFPSMALDAPPAKHDASPIDVYAPKGAYSWRRFSLLHPYSYWHMVNTITAPGAWEELREVLVGPTQVACYSLPDLRPRSVPTARGIQNWLNFERDVRIASPHFTHLAACDIGSFYPSVYTHSIAWALHGRDVAQRERGQMRRLGDQIDTIFRRARRGQTNGLPIGNVVSDVIAELILHDIDKFLSELLPDKWSVARYRDDYRILAPSEADAKKAIQVISRVLHERYDLGLNSEKSHVFSDVVTGSTRPWIAAMRSDAVLSHLILHPPPESVPGADLVAALAAAYSTQRSHPSGSPAISILQKLCAIPTLGSGLRPPQLLESIALLRQLMSLRESITPVAVRMIDILLGHMDSKRRQRLLSDLVRDGLSAKDNYFQQLWIFRLALHYQPMELDAFRSFDNPLLMLALDPERPAVSVFPEIEGLTRHDQRELAKFRLVDPARLARVLRTPIPQSAVNAFAYPTP